MRRVGIIGGTGFSALTAATEPVVVETPFGDVTVGVQRRGALELFFLRRHGEAHVAPHGISHRANVDALARCRVEGIVAINAVGALDPAIPAGSLLVPDDYIDFRTRHESFHEEGAVHVDVSEAYCPTLRALLLRHAPGARDGGVYVATEGPRLETRAEVRALRALGGSVVGMTGCPEAALARERALCYASLCMVTNPAAGVAPGALSAAELKAGAEALGPRALEAAIAAASALGEKSCRCAQALEAARI